MGCVQSKIENEESVSRCKERRNLMKEAVAVRNAFASAQSGYAVSLKNTGAALSDYGAGEVPPPLPAMAVGPGEPSVTERPPPPPPHSMVESSLPPPPPPLPRFSPLPPIQRSMTMPAALSHSEKMKRKINGISIDESDEEEEEEEEEKGGLNRRKKGDEEVGPETPIRTPNPPPPPDLKGGAWDYFFMGDNMPGQSLDEVEEEEDEERYMEGQSNENGNFNNVGDNNMEFKTPEKNVGFPAAEDFRTPEETPVTEVMEKQFVHSNTAPPGMSTGGIGSSVDLSKILGEIDDHFLKASQSAQEVSKMLEATRLHYHSNFADNRGHIDHAARVMQVITWNKSFKGVPNGDGTKDNLDADDYETHATVLDKLLAWEKKLYEEVKAGELMKLEYQRKVSALNKLKKRNASPEQLERAKAAVTHLHTRYIVDWQSLDSTVLEVNDIRDKQLYPKLVALVHGMAKMWESMCKHHDSQLNIVAELKPLEVSGTPIETSKHHHERTIQLWSIVQEWHSQFEKLVTNQRQYIQALNSWLKLNLIPIESSLKEKISSPPRVQKPPIQPLLISWHDQLEKLPDEVAKSAISSFAAVIKAIIDHQEEEMKLKEKYEDTRKEHMRKNQAFQEWYQKYSMQYRTPDEADSEKAVSSNTKDPLSDRQFVVESLKMRMEEEMKDHQKLCIQVREKSLGSLKIRLPEFFRALSDYAHACFDSYERLRLLTLSQHHVNRGS
ncbi:nitrate regulatory gene2 protein-like [Olea europaea var. sylvestris]|uniref:Nitrate regulatory gene2 protein-like n=1 Tax=Olea europaea subsp. europaea TaxID=158383 RepID=A0A8S0PJN2_OLEEU|nr:nitrate regulatory gene2 protein-like [Olea europaea var. sylvestris]CAA2953427.1 Hypothetical predicted protein [Olea europaea subsp. europaea]